MNHANGALAPLDLLTRVFKPTRYSLALDDAKRLASEVAPDKPHELSFEDEVEPHQQETPQMETQVETMKPVKKAPPKKSKAKVSAKTSSKFSEWCAAQKVNGVKARRALRAAGYRAPYDPSDKEVARIAKAAK